MLDPILGNEDKERDLKGISEAQTRPGDMSSEWERGKDNAVYRLSDLGNTYANLEEKEYRRKRRLKENDAVEYEVPMGQLVTW